MSTVENDQTRILKDLFRVGLAAADPFMCVPPVLPPPSSGRTIILGAGKAAAAMARAVELSWHGPLTGLVVTRHGHGLACKHVEVLEAAHPILERRGVEAAERMLQAVRGLSADDLVLCLISGGGSALLDLPAPGLRLENIQLVNRALLRCGATIHQINCVRKHLSALKGGRLAEAAHPARLVTIAISDVPRDDPSTIASGPTVPDPTTRLNAIRVLDDYGIDVPTSIRDHLAKAASETPKPDSPTFARTDFRIAARPADMIAAVAREGRARGYSILNLGADIEGEAREIGFGQAALTRAHQEMLCSGAVPLLIISGGETSVTVNGQGGRGGRNCEYLLSLAIALDRLPGVCALAADTDGIDGSEDNAGAIITPSTLDRARAKGLDPKAFLAANDSYGLFDAIGGLLRTGPTRTNVNDLRLILVNSPRR